MTSIEVHLSEEQDRFVAQQISLGRYGDRDAVISAALALLAREDEEYGEKLEWLRAAIAEGLASGIAEGNVIADVKRESRAIARQQ